MKNTTIPEILSYFMSNPNLASQKPVYEKYDKNVQANTVWERGKSVVSVSGCFNDFPELDTSHKKISVAIGTGGNPFFGKISAEKAAEMAVLEAAIKVSLAGGRLLGGTDCLNFGNPEKTNQMGDLVVGIRGIKSACEALDIPIVSGNVSLYKETNGKAIPSSALASVAGRINNPEKTPPINFLEAGDEIFLIGTRGEAFGGSAFFQAMGVENNDLPTTNFSAVKKWTDILPFLVASGHIKSADFIGHGGSIMTILRGIFGTSFGVHLALSDDFSLAAWLFSENPGGIVTGKKSEIFSAFPGEVWSIGQVTEEEKIIIQTSEEKIWEGEKKPLEEIWNRTLREIF